ncbi:1-aminocyclopropane-1-carboxylate deaminase/D-cysteine desulfhydrase [Tellurirhabdus rosea]|uniref:1-aminocyclopropane-1-carboxylate deaminase/D-cysteine desulfhydrase n=1 Tax=Tellurirhabdus rosea TaxID=2674997 RepID=UPI0022599189|nr:pyridoxal-phosphate dependent enzyme [Tellurirhabdus rosea]
MLPDFFATAAPSRLQFLPDPFPEPVPIALYLKRDDELHPAVSGNKWRKLKYNLLEARRLGHDTLLTYGGAYSNHIHALAAAGQVFGFRTIGVIRGEDHRERDTPTLAYARAQGMHLHFVSRAQFRDKTGAGFQESLRQQFGRFYNVPEGGTNALAVQGVAEVVAEIRAQLGREPDYLCCPVGTGGTLAGLVSSRTGATQILGFAALKGLQTLEAVADPSRGLAQAQILFQETIDDQKTGEPLKRSATTSRVLTGYHFGGYARTTPELLQFIRQFEARTGVRIEQVYTGKMLYGIYDLARQGFFPDKATVVALHTGGLQGRSGELELFPAD